MKFFLLALVLLTACSPVRRTSINYFKFDHIWYQYELDNNHKFLDMNSNDKIEIGEYLYRNFGFTQDSIPNATSYHEITYYTEATITDSLNYRYKKIPLMVFIDVEGDGIPDLLLWHFDENGVPRYINSFREGKLDDNPRERKNNIPRGEQTSYTVGSS